MLAHAGTEAVKGAKLDQAILKLAKGLGLSQKLLGRPEAHESESHGFSFFFKCPGFHMQLLSALPGSLNVADVILCP